MSYIAEKFARPATISGDTDRLETCATKECCPSHGLLSMALASMLTMALSLLTSPMVLASVKPNGLFCDSAVLQQGVPVPVWGAADEGEKVTVRFQQQEVTTIAEGGRWMVRLKPLRAGGPFTMTISGDNTIELRNILVGEVWLCSGQSYMEWSVSLSANASNAIIASGDPMLRLFTAPIESASAPMSDLGENLAIQGSEPFYKSLGGVLPIKRKWQSSGPDSTPGFSALGYFFGRDLRKALNVPVGLICSSVGGTIIQAWTERRYLQANPDLAGILASPPDWAAGVNVPCGLYNGMIAPLMPYAIRGVVWCQGEANAYYDRQPGGVGVLRYRTLLSSMIRNWREDWGQGDFSFLIVQAQPYLVKSADPQACALALLREAQRLASLSAPNTAMVVITDIDTLDVIGGHARVKEPIAARLVLAARAIAYGEKIVYQGPVNKSMDIKGNRATLSFSSVGGGLVAKGGNLRGFTLAGKDGKFFDGSAEIRGEKVFVGSPQVPNPVTVRYGWADYPVVSLCNKEGLPASPFQASLSPAEDQ